VIHLSTPLIRPEEPLCLEAAENVGFEPTWPFQTVPSLAGWVHTIVLLSKLTGLDPVQPLGPDAPA